MGTFYSGDKIFVISVSASMLARNKIHGCLYHVISIERISELKLFYENFF